MALAAAGVVAPLGLRGEFWLFGLALSGVALLHHRSLEAALTGLFALLAFKFLTEPRFDLAGQALAQAPLLLNLFGLLLGFAVLARHFEASRLPDLLPAVLPDNWLGPLTLLALVFVLSSFLDNIAAAMIGGAVAAHVFRGRVHIGYLAAIVAAANAGGAGSVVGDTTTTMMWIAGVHAVDVMHAYIGALAAFVVFGIAGALQQQRHQPIAARPPPGIRLSPAPLLLVVAILGGAIATNVLLDFPAAGVWLVIVVGAALVPTDWRVLRTALRGSVFLLALVACASLVPVRQLPPASWHTAFGLGVVSAVFDNIPLTKLTLEQGGYDWDFVAYAVGFGGSMIWFGSSAGVALCNLFPQGRSVGAWLRGGWHVALAYLAGFIALLALLGWQPSVGG
ncbi:MAG: citrate transporter [Gammaproteobacteria bacterium]|nr:citrate transporter [Gammaproteobacteria bacterium]